MPIIEMKSRTALLGGTFNPVHMGHVHLFHEAYEAGRIGNLIVIPAYISNFKRGSHPVSFSDRVKMLSLAVEDYRDIYPDDKLEITVSLFEGEKGGISYTSDTIREFFDSAEDNGKVNFIIGDDILPSLERWHDYDYLKDNVRFWCFSRGRDALPPASASVIMVGSDVVDASSTEIRHGNLDMLSESVREYVNEHGLYRAE